MTDQERVTLGAVDQRSRANENRISEIQSEVEALRDEHKEDMDKVHEEYKAIYDLTASVKVIADHMEQMNAVVVDTNKKVDDNALAQKETEARLMRRISEVENAPAKKSAEFMDKVKLAIATTVITFLVSGLLAAAIHFG